MTTQTLPYGTWPSAFSAAQVAAAGVGYGQVLLDGPDVLWTENRPAEGGRAAIVRWAAGTVADALPVPFSARSRVHEYGGGAFAAHAGTVYFVNDADQRVYRLDPGAAPQPLTPEVPDRQLRFADLELDPARGLLYCVQEDHRGGAEPVNTLVAVPLDGSAPPRALASGADFYAAPRLSPDGTRLAWIAWQHPNMPWDATELWLAQLDAAGLLPHARRIAGGPDEALTEPCWGPDGLSVVSDRNGWWNLYRVLETDPVALQPRWQVAAECAQPLWTFTTRGYGLAADGSALIAVCANGQDQLTLLAADGAARALGLPYVEVRSVRVSGQTAVCIGHLANRPAELLRLDIPTGAVEVLARAGAAPDPAAVALAQPISFPTAGGALAHGWYYPPHNPLCQGPQGELPPLIVLSHGGPTGMSFPGYDAGVQFWTSRGFGLVEVNYRGSTGYGREYRRALDGQWGIADVDDCAAAAQYLVAQGLADPRRLLIRGSSAGGYTTLCALTFRDLFRAGASYYGISDAATLAADTHKFERRYTDRLIAPYPAGIATYRARSPIHFVTQIACPIILFQGSEDQVVPQAQAEAMAAALQARGLPVELVIFAGEGHGFRRAENIQAALEAELAFYARVIGARG